MSDNERFGPGAYLTPEEAKEFQMFVSSFVIFTIIAIVAHVLVWMWRPWLPSVDGYAMLNDTVQVAAATITTFLA
jgi:light-harvesting complex 1 beta chain